MNFLPGITTSIPKSLFTIAVGTLILLTFFCGVYRNNVPKKEYLELGSQPQFDCVGQILKSDKPSKGSCILIDSTHVLTAAHVFIVSESRPETTTMNGQTVTIYKQMNAHVGKASEYAVSFRGKIYNCASVSIHPAYLDSASKGSCDIALVTLAEPVRDIVPARLNTRFDELHAEVVGVGYGASGPAYPGDSVMQKGEKIGGENIIDSIGGYSVQGMGTEMLCDFDYSGSDSLNVMGSAVPRHLEYMSVGGDSGGGLFRKTAAGWELIGVCSGFSITVEVFSKHGYYGATMEWMRVSLFQDWIRRGKERGMN